jgi:hypothetical protein
MMVVSSESFCAGAASAASLVVGNPVNAENLDDRARL